MKLLNALVTLAVGCIVGRATLIWMREVSQANPHIPVVSYGVGTTKVPAMLQTGWSKDDELQWTTETDDIPWWLL